MNSLFIIPNSLSKTLSDKIKISIKTRTHLKNKLGDKNGSNYEPFDSAQDKLQTQTRAEAYRDTSTNDLWFVTAGNPGRAAKIAILAIPIYF